MTRAARSVLSKGLRIKVRVNIRIDTKPRILAGVKLQSGCQRVWCVRRVLIY